MRDEIVVTDLSKFRSRELLLASGLLKALADNVNLIYNAELQLYFNRNSGCVFIGNIEGETWIMNGDTLEVWYSCPICGHEGFLEDMEHSEENTECEDYCKDIGVWN